MTDQWRELKETITELRDNDGTGTQQEVCKFLANYMDVLEKQMIDPIDRVLEVIDGRLEYIQKTKMDEIYRVWLTAENAIMRNCIEKLRGDKE